jgi:membrane associated rhomboid family serine protease
MARTGSTTLALPPFSGATRRLILLLVGVFFADALLGLVLPGAWYRGLAEHLALNPQAMLHGQVWQLATYSLLPLGIVGTLFACLTVWFVGSMLEEERGGRWLQELFVTGAIAGALLGCLLAYFPLFRINPNLVVGAGPYAGIYGMFLAIAVLMGDVEFLVLFVIRVKVKYLVAIYMLVNLATLLKDANAFGALLRLSGALAGYLYLRYAPGRGYGFSVSEQYFALRNEYYRARRRNAAKKFEVYMRAQNRDVRFDKDGRYVEPQEPARRDPNDKRWMN